MTVPIRTSDIGGIAFPPLTQQAGVFGNVVTTIRPPQFEPPQNSKEFIVSYSLLAPGGGVISPLFVLNPVTLAIVPPSCAVQLPQDNVARISGVSIGGDTGAGGTPPLETFYIANDPAGQLRVPGWEGVGLPARGGIVAVAFEPFTVIQAAGSFFGMFVQNNDGSARYVEGMMTGWYWSLT